MSIEETREFAAIQTDAAPRAIGPYSQAFSVSQGRMVFVSGQIGIDPATAKMVRGGVPEQAKQVMHNLRAVLEAAGGTLRDIVRTTIYLKNLEDFATVNAVYASYLEAPYPARATIEVARLPMDALVEIDAIAVVGDQ
ncbi:MAG: RidA family protein [Deltaproteobacteria bacterium]|nr:RidA family protein [Deltaproteobacteria bacterium]